jgi:hypothetical protein
MENTCQTNDVTNEKVLHKNQGGQEMSHQQQNELTLIGLVTSCIETVFKSTLLKER